MYYVAIRVADDHDRYYAVIASGYDYWTQVVDRAKSFPTAQAALNTVSKILHEPALPQPNGDIHPGRLQQAALKLDIVTPQGKGVLVLLQRPHPAVLQELGQYPLEACVQYHVPSTTSHISEREVHS
jgi:hypothetical protein